MSKRQARQNADCIVVGAGPAGLTLAALLGAAGLHVHVIEQGARHTKKHTVSDGRTVALLRPSVDVLRDAEVDAENLPDTAPLETLSLIDIPPGNREALRADFNAGEIGETYFGLNIRNDQLVEALMAVIRAHKTVTVFDDTRITGIDTSGASAVVTTDHGVFTAPLIIGADGKNSVIRDHAGITTRTVDYKQSAITCLIEHERAHNNTSVEFHRPGGPFTLVPLAGNRSSVVWLETSDSAADIMALDQKSFTARLQDESHDELGTIRVISTPHCWPITLQIADRLFAPRTALVAEAAHALPPSGAQGLNLSLRDVAALSDLVIAHARVGLDVGSDVLLARYARTRSADITPRAYAVDGLNRLILSDQRAVRLLRRRGLAVASALPPVRHALMRFGWASA